MNTSELFFNTPVIDESGHVQNLSDFGGGGSLPIASAETLGGVKIGDGITISEDGTISTAGGALVSVAYTGNGGNISVNIGSPDNVVLLIVSKSRNDLFGIVTANGAISTNGNPTNITGSYASVAKYVDGVLTFTAQAGHLNFNAVQYTAYVLL